jgi:exonuclease SbcC
MKILTLQFTNLNSLYGSWTIDFTKSEYKNYGLFAITGNTGAGKTTVLDAVCLALYGQVPRLGNITKTSNNIMSKKTAECSSEIIFETAKGRYRVKWHQHRARNSVDGNLQEPLHEISDSNSGQLIESKKSRVSEIVEMYTGLDFYRFTRSIMLAQGNFAAFLNAKSDERSEILEQITGTKIYSDISMYVYKKTKELSGLLSEARRSMDDIQFLNTDEVKKLEERTAVLKQNYALYSDEKKKLIKAINWLNELDKLRDQLDKAESDKTLIEQEKDSFKTDEQRLENALKAVELDSDYSVLKSKEEYLVNEKEELNKLIKSIKQSETDLNNTQVIKSRVESSLTEAENNVINEQSVIKEVRSLDQQIAAVKKRYSEAENRESVLMNEVTELKEKYNNARKQIEFNQNQLNQSEQFKEKNKHDEVLISKLDLVKEWITAINKTETERKRVEDEKKEIIIKLGKSEKESLQFETSINDLTKNIQLVVEKTSSVDDAIQVELNGKLQREYSAELEFLQKEQLLQAKIADLEMERKKLVKGEPCPLCGSKIHPYVQSHLEYKDELQMDIDTLKHKLEKIKQLEDEKNSIEKELYGLNQEKIKKEADYSLIQKTIESLKSDRDKLNVQTDRLIVEKERMLKEIKSIFDLIEVQLTDIDNPESLLFNLEQRVAKYKRNEEDLKKFDTALTEVKIESEKISIEIKNRINMLSESEKELKLLKKEIDELSEKRISMYGNKNPDSEEKMMHENVLKLKEKLKKAESDYTKHFTAYNELKTQIGVHEKNIEETSPIVTNHRENFLKRCLLSGFNTIELYVAAAMTADERKKIVERRDELTKKITENKSNLTRLSNELTEKQQMKLTADSVINLEISVNELDEKIKMTHEETGSIDTQLKENRNKLKRFNEKKQYKDKIEKEHSRWDKLNHLIGSSSGIKFRKFAQGLTFDHLVMLANSELRKMSERYLLHRSGDEGLDLNVVDNYQGGSERTTKNLSGGESFIVSMSLALGLSKMSSNTVQVNSLFLDEGFDTLDDETLEVALNTLSSLHQEGKIIGVISHLESLKSRIPTQIQVIKKSGGKSILLGPGVSAGKGL